MRNDRWAARPGLARIVGLLATLIPVIVGVVVGFVVSRRVGSGVWAGLAGMVASLVAVWLTQRVTRKLLPLATLLQLELPFPGKAPSRFSVALRAGSTRSLPGPDDEAPADITSAAADILALATALSQHDRATRGHSERVRALTDLLGEEIGLASEDRDRLRWAALLHDIGKLSVHHEVLNKPSTLSDQEWEILRRHPLEGAARVEPLRAFLGPWTQAVEHHHERWDGGGYPHGLAGEEISLGARIVAVADVYEVMTSPRRIYRSQVSPADAKRELAAVAGKQLDPQMVSAFLRLDDRDLRRAMHLLVLVLQLPNLLRWRAPLRVASPTGMADPSGTLSGDQWVHQPNPDAARHDSAMSHPDVQDIDPGLADGADVDGAAHDL